MIRTFVLAVALAVTGSAIAAPGTPIELSDVRQNLFATCFTSDTLPLSTTCCRQRNSCASRSIFTGHTAVHDPHSVDANGSDA